MMKISLILVDFLENMNFKENKKLTKLEFEKKKNAHL